MLTAFLGFGFVWFPSSSSSSNLALFLPLAMFGEMAADSGMGMSFHQGVATSTSLYHHHMLSFQSNPDSTPTAAAITTPTTPAPAPAPAPAHGIGPNSAVLFLPPPNTPMFANVASSSSSLHGVPSTPKYKFVTGSPADWTSHELAVFKEGLIRYAHEPNIMKYIKIAAMLPTRTIRDVALRCWWTTGKECSRRKPDELYAGKKIRDFKEKMVASTSVANFQMAPLNNVVPFSTSMHHAGQNSLVPKEVPVLDNATQHLLEENNQLLSQIAANIETFKMEENLNLFLRMNNNIRTISKRMSETPGIMGQMPPLPLPVNEDHLNSLLQLDRVVVIGDVVLACIFGFLPFSLGRIILCCTSCFNFGNVDKVHSYTSTASILLVGYGFILSLGVLFTGLHTFLQYSRGERLMITIFFKVFTNGMYWLLSPFGRLPGIHVMVHRTFSFLQLFFRGITNLITVANICLNLINTVVMCPLFFGWSLDICTSKLFGATISEKLKLLFASSFASTALHWLIGCICLKLHFKISSLLRPVLRPGVNIPFVHIAEDENVMQFLHEPFYKKNFKMLPGLFVSVIYVAMVILVPVQIASQLAPKVFPLDITYFDPPTQGTSFWQAPRNYAELLAGVVLLRLLICNTLKYLEPGALVEKVLRYWFATTGQALGLSDLLIVRPDGAVGREVGNSVATKDQHGSTAEAKGKRKFVAVRVMLLVLLAWLTVVMFNSAVLTVPISVGRALLFAIPQLPVAGGLKSNDLFAFAIGFCIISTIIAASRDSFAYMTSGRTHLLASVICKWGITALKSSPLLFIWIVIIPLLIGLLVDFLLISPFIVPANDVPFLDLFCTWFLGLLLLKFWTKLAHWTRVAPFLAYFIDERWDWKLTQAREDGLSGLRAMWVLQDVLMPITTKLLTALCVPYVLAKGVFPCFGYSVAVNSTVYHFAWLGSLAFFVLCYLAKVFLRALVKLHDSIRDERYLIGQRLQNYADTS